MENMHDIGDTVAAVSTPPGMGGIGIVRMSGPEALAIADKIFVSRSGGEPSGFKTHTVHYGDVFSSRDGRREILDEALVTVMRAPASYTREDIVEISCHGGSAAVNAVLSVCLRNGARLAVPGEFTKRAFLNGRIDLTQAEAVLDIICARTAAGLVVSEHQLKGELSLRLEQIRELLMAAYLDLEALVNFPEDSVMEDGGQAAVSLIRQARVRITDLLATADQGRIVREGIKIVLCGRTNVGKSSLLNTLLGHPRAIVSPVAGTTRDAIEESAQIQGIPVQMVDTAGILHPRDEIEEEAVRRSRMQMDQADLIILMLDAGHALTEQDLELVSTLKGRDVMCVINKTDLQQALEEDRMNDLFSGQPVQRISVLTGEGIEGLKKAVSDRILHGRKMDVNTILLSNVRHIDALEKCQGAVQECLDGPQLSAEFLSENVRRAVHYLDQITGRDAGLDLLDQIFSKFCIGK